MGEQVESDELWLTWDEDDGSELGTTAHFALWLRRQRVEAMAMVEQSAVGMARTAGTPAWQEWADRLDEARQEHREAVSALDLLDRYLKEHAQCAR